jgi:uncharacterized membrane protein YkgB
MLGETFIRCEGAVHRWLVRYSVLALRISLGVIFLGFGALKYVPGLSPAQSLVEATLPILTFGLVTGYPGMVVVATLECVIGLSLLTQVGLRAVIYLLGIELLGILSPVVLLPARIFAGPYGAPTLEGQYVLKDIILVAAAMVVVAANFRGARIAYRQHTPRPDRDPVEPPPPERPDSEWSNSEARPASSEPSRATTTPSQTSAKAGMAHDAWCH